VSPAFIDLLTVARQIRASFSRAGTAGDLQPLPESGPWQTPLWARGVYPLREALTQSGQGRETTLKEAVERKTLGDLRLVPGLLDALGDGYAPVADLVAGQALPAVGRAVLPDLRAGLDLQGKVIDARKLWAICLIDPKEGAEWCRKAIKEGNATLRVQALERLPEVGKPGEAEKAGLELSREKNA